MIHDVIGSPTATFLAKSSKPLREALDWICQHAATASEGETELRGRKCYINVHGYDTLPVESCTWESHRHTVDLQYCIRGGEKISWMVGQPLKAKGPYISEKDTQKWEGLVERPVDLCMVPGSFAIFLPGEFHRPKMKDGMNRRVHKLVAKIDAELLSL